MELSKKKILVAVVTCVLIFLALVWYYFKLKKPESFTNAEGNDKEVDSTTLGLADDELGFIKVSATWCGHCKTMQGDWDKLFAEYHDKKVNGKTVKIITIDENNDIQDAFMAKYNIEGYPTILKFDGSTGNPKIFDGERGYDDLSAFLTAL